MRVVGPELPRRRQHRPAGPAERHAGAGCPRPAAIGFFSQSGCARHHAARHRRPSAGSGLSTFVSAGNRADVCGNDLLQYWQDDPRHRRRPALPRVVSATRASSPGWPAGSPGTSRSSRCKTGRSTQASPLGHRRRRTTLPAGSGRGAVRSSPASSEADTSREMFDVAQLLAYQPLPAGRRVAVVGNSDALGLLAADACESSRSCEVGRRPDVAPHDCTPLNSRERWPRCSTTRRSTRSWCRMCRCWGTTAAPGSASSPRPWCAGRSRWWPCSSRRRRRAGCSRRPRAPPPTCPCPSTGRCRSTAPSRTPSARCAGSRGTPSGGPGRWATSRSSPTSTTSRRGPSSTGSWARSSTPRTARRQASPAAAGRAAARRPRRTPRTWTTTPTRSCCTPRTRTTTSRCSSSSTASRCGPSYP